MTDRPPIDDLDLTDSELMRVIKNHGIDRRSLMTLVGAGALASTVSGTASAKHSPQHTPVIDPYYGYAAPAEERLPRKLQPDHEVGLHVHEPAIFSPDPTDVPFHFEPMGLQIDVGDIVRFNFETPEHSVTGYHQRQGREHRVPGDALPFSSPIVSGGGFWLYRFDSPGTYDIFCAPHEPFGMVMRLVVGDPSSSSYDGTFEQTGRPPFSRAELTLIGIPDFPFPTPHAIYQTDALAVGNIDAGGVGVGDVESDLDDLPIVTRLIPTEVSGSSTDATFDVLWTVADPAGNLDEVTLVMIDLDSGPPPGPEGPPQTVSVSGAEASGTTSIVAPGDEDQAHDYVVQATVTDGNGHTTTSAVPVTEDPSI